MRLNPIPPGRYVSGKIVLDGVDTLKLSESEMTRMRGDKIAMILQDPMTSLNPVFTIGDQVTEAIRIHQHMRSKRGLFDKAVDVLKKVRIPAADVRMRDFPHQLSGGMRQRVVGAIGISCEPSVLIADEPTTSLDATVQAQYLRLLRELQQESGMAIIYITHDFGIVAKLCDRVIVMYAGRIVEQGSVREIFNNPRHPYTEALLGSVPKLEEDVNRLYQIEGQPPALYNLPKGCSFAPRCKYVMDRCKEEYPPVFKISEGHESACWRVTTK
jgi:oligopeptide/dipeptide ABC transporter ATP-binding protein